MSNNEREEGALAPRLPTFVRFRDLRNSGIADNWPTLLRMIDEQGFPPGVRLSPNVRAWDLDEVRQWLASRPTERKIVAPRKKNMDAELAS